MAALIEEEALDEDGRPKKQSNPRRLRKRKRKQAKKTTQKADDSDEDSNFLTSSSSEETTSESGSDKAEGVIPNDEVDSSLPFLQPISYTVAFCRLLTCSLRRRHPALHEPN
jgi:hypothetical protein